MNKLVSKSNLADLSETLARDDIYLSRVFKSYGAPPLWKKPQSFATLVDIILGQQVSLASAKACFEELEAKIGVVTPDSFLALDDGELRAVGFSRQKTAYCRNAAIAIARGTLDLDHLRSLPDADVKTELEKIKGIGNWTSDIYLLMAMLRPDVMPRGDLALHIAWQKLVNLDRPPQADKFRGIAEKWRPLRSVAARLLWHFYLSEIRPQSGF